MPLDKARSHRWENVKENKALSFELSYRLLNPKLPKANLKKSLLNYNLR